MEKYTKTILLVCIVATPSLFFLFLDENFQFTKVYFLTLFLSFANLLLVLSVKKIKLGLLDLTLLFVALVYLLSSVFAIDFYTSLFGYYKNFNAPLLFIFTVFIFLILFKKFLLKVKYEVILNLVLTSAFIPFAYAFLQFLNLDFVTWQNTQNRVFSTFGQPNLFANYLLLILFISLFFVLERQKKFYLLITVSSFLLLLKTLSLSAFLSFLLLLFLYFVFRKGKFNNQYAFLALIFFLLTFLLFGSNLYSRVFKQVYASTAEIVTNDTAKIRKIVWLSSVNKNYSLKQVLLGEGSENFVYFYNRSPKLNNTSEWSIIFNKPHNFLIEEFLEVGVLGLFIFVYIFIVSLLKIKQNILPFLALVILIPSLFLWINSYLFFLLFLFVYIFNKNFNKSIFIVNNTNRVKILLTLLTTILIFTTTLFVTSYFLFKENPCLSKKLVPFYQPYGAYCSALTSDVKMARHYYNLNKDNKSISEYLLLAFLYKNSNFSKEIIFNNYYLNKENPINIYYVGLYYELIEEKTLALSMYKQAISKSHNFYRAIEASQRILYIY